MIDTIEKSGSGHPPGNRDDRPGWIPAEIESDWDPSPYAYQTEEELMPQGLLHDILNSIICEVLRPYLERCGLKLRMDIFMLYRDKSGTKRRIAPDFMLDFPEDELTDQSWDLDRRSPPKLVGEVTSPDSRDADYEENCVLYQSLGIENYVVIDGLDSKGKETGLIRISLWINGIKIQPNQDGFLKIPEMNVDVLAENKELVFHDPVNKNPLLRQNEKDQIIEENNRLIEQLQKELEGQRNGIN